MPKSDPLRALESRLRADDPRSRGPTEAAARPPRDVEAWRRYGELLAAAGDPRAELVAIELRFLERSPREELELLRRRNVLQADLKRAHGLDEDVSGEWRWAFFVPSSVGGDLVGAVGRLAACSFVFAPDLELDFDGSTQPLGDALGSLVHLAPRTLRLKDVARPREALESLLAQGRPLLARLEGFALSCDEQPVFETEPLLLAALLEALPVVRGLTLWSCGLAEAGMVTLVEHASRRLLADVADFDEESSARLRAFRPRLFISGSPDSLTLAVQRSDHWRA